MKLTSKVVTGFATGCAAVALCAAPASAAPLTVETDAGTSCTVEAGYALGGGLLVRPINFTGTIDCALADPANAPSASGQLLLTSSAPLSLGSAGGQPNEPQETVGAGPGAPAGEFAFRCDVAPGADCGFSGQSTGLPTASYQVIFGETITAPEGETWTVVPKGCELSEESSVVACSSVSETFTTN